MRSRDSLGSSGSKRNRASHTCLDGADAMLQNGEWVGSCALSQQKTEIEVTTEK
jgi:hypothetical protein